MSHTGIACRLAAMARKRTAPRLAPPKALRGRPPLQPRTTLARYIRAHGMTVVDFAAKMAQIAPKCGLPPEASPRPKTLLDAVNGRHWPSIVTVLIVKYATNGDVDLEHWVRDMHPDAFERQPGA